MATLSSPQVASGWTPRVQEKGTFSIAGEYTLTATLASGDVIRMLKVPDGVTVEVRTIPDPVRLTFQSAQDFAAWAADVASLALSFKQTMEGD